MSDISRRVSNLLLLNLVLTAGAHAQEPALPDTAVDSLPAEQHPPIKHTLGYGITNGGIGYRHTFSGQQLRPYLSAGAFTISLGLEHIPKHSTHYSFEYMIGESIFGPMIGAKWMWHLSGPRNKGLAVGFGPTYIRKNRFFWFDFEKDDSVTFADLSINWKW